LVVGGLGCPQTGKRERDRGWEGRIAPFPHEEAGDQRPCRPYCTVTLSKFAVPLAVVAVRRMVLLPALRVLVTITSLHVSQDPVLGKETAACTTVPLMRRSAGRSAVPPFA